VLRIEPTNIGTNPNCADRLPRFHHGKDDDQNYDQDRAQSGRQQKITNASIDECALAGAFLKSRVVPAQRIHHQSRHRPGNAHPEHTLGDRLCDRTKGLHRLSGKNLGRHGKQDGDRIVEEPRSQQHEQCHAGPVLETPQAPSQGQAQPTYHNPGEDSLQAARDPRRVVKGKDDPACDGGQGHQGHRNGNDPDPQWPGGGAGLYDKTGLHHPSSCWMFTEGIIRDLV
jgi:hypothetical protein